GVRDAARSRSVLGQAVLVQVEVWAVHQRRLRPPLAAGLRFAGLVPSGRGVRHPSAGRRPGAGVLHRHGTTVPADALSAKTPWACPRTKRENEGIVAPLGGDPSPKAK